MDKVKAYFIGNSVSSNTSEAFSLYEKSRFGEQKGEKIIYSIPEVIFLLEKNKIELIQNKKSISKKEFIEKASKFDKKILTKYVVFKDLREKGYILKTGLKFGADFRVYEKGKKPSEEHAKWILFIEKESKKTSWQEFSALNRVAHSTKKNLLICIVDDEEDITYYEIKWIKP